MKAVVFHGIGDIRLDDVPEPRLIDAQDAIVCITTSAICGTDLHMVRGSMTGMEVGTVLGHEGVGVVQELARNVRNLRVGDRVVVASTIACGYCAYCRAGYSAMCDEANPKHKGTAFFGGPADTGPFDGLQAEYARIPFAPVGLVRLPDEVSDEQAILLSDIFPTAYFGAELAEIKAGDTVAVFGCGPVGLFAIASAKLLGAVRVLAVDHVASRLAMAKEQGAETIDFEREDPVATIKALTGGIGVDRAIDAVGVDAQCPHQGPASGKEDEQIAFELEAVTVAPEMHPDQDNWKPGDAPSQVLRWAVDALAKAGTLGIIGVYPPSAKTFPIGAAMNKNLTIKTGNCNHRRYIPELVRWTSAGLIDPANVLTQRGQLVSAIDAYKAFDRRDAGWTKVALQTAA